MGRPLAPSGGNDRVSTPYYLADAIVKHFMPSGIILEPCAGKVEKPFITAFRANTRTPLVPGFNPFPWCEIDEGSDFFNWSRPVDWIVTNPPWSKFRSFLQHSMRVSDNIVFLALTNAWFMKARQRDLEENGFGLVELAHVETPEPPWPQTGFQLSAGWAKRGWDGSTNITYLATPK